MLHEHELYFINEAAVNVVAQTNNDGLAQQMAAVLEKNTVNVSEGLTPPPVKRCYPY